jgi:signal transduction histidine kinase
MAELVNDLLEVSRIEAGSIELSETTVPLADVLVAARDQVEPTAVARGVGLAIRPPSRLRVAFGDRRAIERIVVNLVGNAVKYTESGGRVDVDVAPDGLVALVVVRDTGAGIAPEDRGRVFERFARLDRHRSLPGTGLGLSIARDLSRLMGGDIGLASRPGAGSAFILALPGPTRPDPAAVAAALARAVVAEQERLDAAAP